jgi:hypothetical protein
MLSRAVCVMFVLSSFHGVALADKPQGNVIRPVKVAAKVKGCQVSKPGDYRATAGDLIELEYTFPVVPGAMPEDVGREWDRGAIYGSKLGIRNLIVPEMLGTGTYLFYFLAKHEGSGTAFVIVDGVKYEYKFEVAAAPKKSPKKEKQQKKKGAEKKEKAS